MRHMYSIFTGTSLALKESIENNKNINKNIFFYGYYSVTTR